MRGGIARFCLAPSLGRKVKIRASAVERLEKLADWLAATGEFKQESPRVVNWRDYLARLNPEKATHWLHVARDLFNEFEHEAAAELGAYTCGVDAFLKPIASKLEMARRFADVRSPRGGVSPEHGGGRGDESGAARRF